ncbi:hypothetical protein TKK_0012505 [Trichogramma kaykai]
MTEKNGQKMCETPFDGWKKCFTLARDLDIEKLKIFKADYESMFKEKINKLLDNGKSSKLTIKPDALGRGLYASDVIKEDEYVTEYKGKLIRGWKSAIENEKFHSQRNDEHSYLFFFRAKSSINYCIDATEDDGSYGRLINHSDEANVKPTVWINEKGPHIIFFATKDILEGQEIVYNYSEHRKTILQAFPCLKLTKGPDMNAKIVDDKISTTENEDIDQNLSKLDLVPKLLTEKVLRVNLVRCDTDTGKNTTGKRRSFSLSDIEAIGLSDSLTRKVNNDSLENLNQKLENVNDEALGDGNEVLERDNDVSLRNVQVPTERESQIMNSSTGGFCIYCLTVHTNFIRHLLSNHLNIPKIKTIAFLKPRTSQRRNLIYEVRLLGLRLFNQNYNQRIPNRY